MNETYRNVETDPLEVAEVDDSDLEEVEPEVWPLDRIDKSIEGFEGYSEEEVTENDNNVDSIDNKLNLSGETD